MAELTTLASVLRSEPTRASLDELYFRFNRRDQVHPDPVEFLYRYENSLDREIAGIIASSLAYGRVRQILKSVERVLGRMGQSPRSFLLDGHPSEFSSLFCDFRHRFTSGSDLVRLLDALKRMLLEYGSLHACFSSEYDEDTETILPALSEFVSKLAVTAECNGMFLPSPSRGSACKRMNLFLRWMVRRDNVDPGGWQCVSPSKLIVPLDTHMHRIGLALGFTRCKQANMRTALEITRAFRRFDPHDPVRYDFALTRIGILGR